MSFKTNLLIFLLLANQIAFQLAADAQNQRRARNNRIRAVIMSGRAGQAAKQVQVYPMPDLKLAPPGSSKANTQENEKNEKQAAEKTESDKRESDKEEKKHKNKSSKSKVRGDAPCMSWAKFGVPVRAVLLCVHGLGLNGNCFEKLGKDMSQLGVATYAIDVRGFGSYMNAKGHEKVDLKECVNDLKETLSWLHKANPGRKVFLLGESMGGAIALHAGAQFPELMDGVISVCSAAERFKQKKTDLKVFLHMLSGPKREFDIGKQILDQAAGDNPALKEKWQEDDLARMNLSPVELMQFQSFMNENHEMAEKITSLPVLMVQGTKDKLVKPEGTQELYDELKTPDKELFMVENAEHLIFENDQFSSDTLNRVAEWIFKRCPPDPLADAKAALDAGKAQMAVSILKRVLEKDPQNPGANLLMGQAHARLKHFLIARQFYTRALRSGRGSEIASDANKMLMLLPQGFAGPQGMQSRKFKQASGKPTVLVFNASWCKPCQDMNEIVSKAKTVAGNRVDFRIIDVDDPKNDSLIEQYSIGPVPTTIFIDANGKVAGFQVGFDDGIDGMVRGVQKILPKSGPGAGPASRARRKQSFQFQPAQI